MLDPVMLLIEEWFPQLDDLFCDAGGRGEGRLCVFPGTCDSLYVYKIPRFVRDPVTYELACTVVWSSFQNLYEIVRNYQIVSS
jgi:hypothetical protein